MYAQVYAGYRDAILDGRLPPGQRLPSTRSLAQELAVSRITVVTAFQQLLAEGYLEGRVGAGTFVSSAFAARVVRAPHRAPAPGRRRVPRDRLAPVTEPWLACWGAFRVGQPAVEQFPAEVWARLVARCARRLPRREMSYGEPMGFLPLRQAIADVLRTTRSVRCTAEQVMIVSGSQQGLAIAARTLLAPGDAVWLEEPCYPGARDAFALVGARPIRVPVDGDGLDVAAGIARHPRARAAYVTPSHQYPLGVIMSAPRRLELLDWARRAGAWLIEDDYDSEHHYDHQPIASLQALDTDQRVVYVGTFSKVLFPALRIGYVVVPNDLVPWFQRVRATLDNFATPLYQRVLNEFIREGHFMRHLRRMRSVYAERRRVLVRALERELGDQVELLGDRAGMHVVITLPPGARDRDVALRAAARGLSVIPLSSCYAGPRPRAGLLLGYGASSPARIPEAVAELARAIAG